MRRVLRFFRMAEYGGDELVLGTLCCLAVAWTLNVLVTPLLSLVMLPPWLIIVYFFRDPNRTIPSEAEVWVSPADGTITDIVEVDEPHFIKGKALRIGMFLSPLNVHVNRVPMAGRVEYIDFRAGEFLAAYNPKAPERNESITMGLITAEGGKFLVKQITGVLARRIVCEATVGQELTKGERYGMIKFGSRTELYIPSEAGFEPMVKIGDSVQGGTSIMLKGILKGTRDTVSSEASNVLQT